MIRTTKTTLGAGLTTLMVAAALLPKMASAGWLGIGALAGAPTAAEKITFWGKPFPYRYARRKNSCEQYRQVDTPQGLVWESKWVCGPRGARVSSKY